MNIDAREHMGFHFDSCARCEVSDKSMRPTNHRELIYGCDRRIYECIDCGTLAVSMPYGWYIL